MGLYDESWARRTDETIEDHQRRIDTLEAEGMRTRRRLHDLESDRAAHRMLTKLIGELAVKVSETSNAVDAIAEAAVNKVMAKRSLQRRTDWKYRMGLATSGAAIASFVIGLIAYLH